MFKPFSYPTDTEIEILFSDLPEKTAEHLHALVKQLRTEKPDCSGLNLSNETPYIGSVDHAKSYIYGLLKQLRFHRQQSFVLSLEASSCRQESIKLKKENEILAAENRELQLANERQKNQKNTTGAFVQSAGKKSEIRKQAERR